MSSWWSLPRALEVDGDLVYGGVSTAGSVVIYDRGTRRVVGTARADDHCTPSILMPSDKPPIVAWTDHSEAGDVNVKIRKGTVNGDLTSLGAAGTITFADDVSYSQIFRRGSTDNLILFTRSDNGVEQDHWWFVRSSNYATTWAAPVLWLDLEDEKGYMNAVQVGDVLRVAVGGHPQTGFAAVYYCSIDLVSGDIDLADGTTIGNLSGTNLPITRSELVAAWSPIATDRARLLDVSTGPDPELAIGVYTTDDDMTYRYLHWNGTTWDDEPVVAAGRVFGFEPSAHYNGGASFPNPSAGGIVYLSREDEGRWSIEKHATADDGATWVVDVMAEHFLPLVRPYCPIDADSGPEVVFHKVWRYHHYTDYLATLVAPA